MMVNVLISLCHYPAREDNYQNMEIIREILFNTSEMGSKDSGRKTRKMGKYLLYENNTQMKISKEWFWTASTVTYFRHIIPFSATVIPTLVFIPIDFQLFFTLDMKVGVPPNCSNTKLGVSFPEDLSAKGFRWYEWSDILTPHCFLSIESLKHS